MKHRFFALQTAIFLALVMTVLPARAQHATIELDPTRSRVEFTLGATMHTVRGTFKLKHGAISFNPSTGDAAGRVVIDATSADTGNDGRDNKMHEEILESQKYPEIVFAPKRIEGQVTRDGSSQVRLNGIFAIHGTEQQVDLDVVVRNMGDEWTAETTFAVPYVNWGLKNPSTFFLRAKDTVNVTVRAVGRVPNALR
jgi:polyisoprenoid-binding protein YceI